MTDQEFSFSSNSPKNEEKSQNDTEGTQAGDNPVSRQPGQLDHPNQLGHPSQPGQAGSQLGGAGQSPFGHGEPQTGGADNFSAQQASKKASSFVKAKKGVDFSKAQPLQGVYFIPEDALPRKKWRKRHPKLFWAITLLGIFFIFNIIGGVYMALDEAGKFSGPRIGIARLEGMILDSADMVSWLDHLQHNQSVKGVLLFINSGGGAVVPSQEIYMAVKRLANTKPVVTYMSSAAASGGYYAAVGSQYIVASPSTLTGSIGVRMDMANMQKLFDTIGIKQQSLASGPMKSAGTPFRPLRPDEEAYLRGIVDDMYEVFIQDVANGRKMELEEVRKLADGRAYTGRQAHELGLVDELGDSSMALLALKARCGLADEPAVDFLDGPPPEKTDYFGRLLSNALRDVIKDIQAAQTQGPAFYY